MAQLLHDPEDIARHQAMLRPWVFVQMDYVIRIPPEIVTGFRLVPPPTTDRSR